MEITNKTYGEKEVIFQQTYLKALLDNKNNLNQWKAFKEKYEEVIKNLNFYNEKSKHSICIPLGKKAFVKGHLVHTNDVWVTLGCGWFLKTSTKKAVEICERRIQHANELIEKWEKENKLLESMRDYSINKDVFGRGDSKEIVEPFDENQEKNWKEEHKKKERKYRQQLKELREKTGSATLNDEKDIWEHLEALELQEELEDELNRLGHNDTSSEEDEDNETDSDDISINEDDTSRDNDEDMAVQHKSIYQSKITDITNADVNTECERSFLIASNESKPHSKSTEGPIKMSKKRVTFEDADNLEVKNAHTENIQDAVLDTVRENMGGTCKSENVSDQKRSMSKFKMNRNLSK